MALLGASIGHYGNKDIMVMWINWILGLKSNYENKIHESTKYVLCNSKYSALPDKQLFIIFVEFFPSRELLFWYLRLFIFEMKSFLQFLTRFLYQKLQNLGQNYQKFRCIDSGIKFNFLIDFGLLKNFIEISILKFWKIVKNAFRPLER